MLKRWDTREGEKEEGVCVCRMYMSVEGVSVHGMYVGHVCVCRGYLHVGCVCTEGMCRGCGCACRVVDGVCMCVCVGDVCV